MTMPIYRNFREILQVYPEWDEQCSGITLADERCRIKGTIGKQNRFDAGVLLDKMDRTTSLSSCRQQLGKLAYLTMCGFPHRNSKYAQRKRSDRWNETISAWVADHSEKAIETPVLSSIKVSGTDNQKVPDEEQELGNVSYSSLI